MNENAETMVVAGAIGQRVTDREILAYAAAASRGDVLPTCLRLTAARRGAEWMDRARLALSVGPACPEEILHRACLFMPRAPEPRLLRAARAMHGALHAADGDAQEAALCSAALDLEVAAYLDPEDSSVRFLFAELARVRAMSVRPAA